MNTSPYIERLRAQCPGFKFIGGALDLNESTLQPVVFPAAFVLPLNEQADANPMLGSHLQLLHQNWGVVILLKAIRTTVTDQSTELQTLRDQVRSSLIGWSPEPVGTTPLEFNSGQMIGLENGMLMWQDDYSTTYYLQGT
jgi:hypothetical protein